ncbi:MAG: hypothetical protein A3H32_01925 [Betaproteobacteria bacterium RIFCSPLOWO2_02_FULL_63_19]|nr:MAG: hypothetical protein A3H32_01925 [Betaproteobacteria bacterium RIFCSPLOWO2_02_FULL_63_19]
MKRRTLLKLSAALVAAASFTALPTAAAGAPIKLRTVSFLPQNHGSSWGFKRYAELLNEAGKGRIEIDYVGGPEAIKAFEQPEAVRTGAVDAAYTVGAYYKTMIPEANSMSLSQLTPWQERESGYFDHMQSLHKAKNLYLLGRQLVNSPFILSTSKTKVTSPRDLKGMKFRTAALYDGMYKKLGIVGITMPLGDQYSALERGLVDGTASSPSSALRFSLYEVNKYVIGPLFFGANNGVLMINLDTWKKIPADLQKLMQEVQLRVERETWDHYGSALSKQIAQLKGKGMEFVEWSAAENQWFLDTAYTANWAEIEGKTSKETVEKLKRLTRKR